MNIPDNILYATKLDHFCTDATDNASDNTHFDSDTLNKYTCPADRRWYFLGGIVNRDVSGTLTITLRDSSDEIIGYISYAAAATGRAGYPGTIAATANWQMSLPIVMDAGDYIHIAFGASQSTAAESSCVVLEVLM